jgi:hypothetical protein
MTDGRPPATGGFIQFGNGPQVPITSCTWTTPKPRTLPEGARLELLQDFTATIPLPPETAARIFRAIGMPAEADRIEVQSHPDLAELNARLDGFYDGTA